MPDTSGYSSGTLAHFFYLVSTKNASTHLLAPRKKCLSMENNAFHISRGKFYVQNELSSMFDWILDEIRFTDVGKVLSGRASHAAHVLGIFISVF